MCVSDIRESSNICRCFGNDLCSLMFKGRCPLLHLAAANPVCSPWAATAEMLLMGSSKRSEVLEVMTEAPVDKKI